MNDERSKRRIVMIGTSFDTMGGISTVVKGYAEEGLLDRHAVRYIVTHCDGSVLRKLAVAIAGAAKLFRISASEAKLLLHIHLSSRASFWRKSVYCLIALMFRNPYILHIHGSEFMRFYRDECGPLGKIAVRFILSRAACLLALSESWRADLKTITPASRIEVVPNAVPLIDLGPERERPRRVILFLGRLGRRKGVDDLVKAFARLADDFPDVDVVCAGDGDIAATLETVRALGLEGRVSCPGWLRGADKTAILARSVLFALPSYAEGLPMALLEAMAARLPVVATNVGGIPEAVRHGVEGYLITPGDVDELCRHMRTLLEDETLRRRLAGNARQRIEDSFALPRVVQRVEAVYRSLA